jgi:hypothetical protein
MPFTAQNVPKPTRMPPRASIPRQVDTIAGGKTHPTTAFDRDDYRHPQGINTERFKTLQAEAEFIRARSDIEPRTRGRSI